MSLFTNKTLMITGGTGSFGNAVLNRKKIARYIDVDFNLQLQEETKRMTGLGESIYISGIKTGETKQLINLVCCKIFEGEETSFNFR